MRSDDEGDRWSSEAFKANSADGLDSANRCLQPTRRRPLEVSAVGRLWSFLMIGLPLWIVHIPFPSWDGDAVVHDELNATLV
jgi:hypothetical protein